MQQISATRSELLARRARVALAAQGRDILVDKRGALMREFDRLGTSVLESMQALERRAGEAEQALRVTVIAEGPEAVRSAAFASGGETPLLLKSRSVAGVSIVEIEHEPVPRPRQGRGYSLAGTTARTDEVAHRFESLLEGLLELAALELSLRRLADEITRTTRRVNALENVIMPMLQDEHDFIALVLDEREAEGRVRLRRARAKAARQRGAA